MWQHIARGAGGVKEGEKKKNKKKIMANSSAVVAVWRQPGVASLVPA